jgi:hypothetical protein
MARAGTKHLQDGERLAHDANATLGERSQILTQSVDVLVDREARKLPPFFAVTIPELRGLAGQLRRKNPDAFYCLPERARITRAHSAWRGMPTRFEVATQGLVITKISAPPLRKGTQSRRPAYTCRRNERWGKACLHSWWSSSMTASRT